MTVPGVTANSQIFQSTPPMQGATILHIPSLLFLYYFNPRPLCRGRHKEIPSNKQVTNISIHAPYAGGDGSQGPGFTVRPRISIHAPYAGGDVIGWIQLPEEDISIHAPYAGGDGRPPFTTSLI